MRKMEFTIKDSAMFPWQENMLRKASIPGFFTPVFTKLNNEKKIVYDVKGYRTLREYLAVNGDRDNRLRIFQDILLKCIDLEEEFLLPAGWAFLDPGKIYVDRYGGETSMLCVPGNRTEPGFLAAEVLDGIWEEGEEPLHSMEQWLEFTGEKIRERAKSTSIIIGPQPDEEDKKDRAIKARLEEVFMYKIFEEPGYFIAFLGVLFILGVLFGLLT